MSLPKLPDHLTTDSVIDLRLLLLDAMEDLAGVATLLREAQETLENGERAASAAQMCASDAGDAADDAIEKLRRLALKLEEFAS